MAGDVVGWMSWPELSMNLPLAALVMGLLWMHQAGPLQCHKPTDFQMNMKLITRMCENVVMWFFPNSTIPGFSEDRSMLAKPLFSSIDGLYWYVIFPALFLVYWNLWSHRRFQILLLKSLAVRLEDTAGKPIMEKAYELLSISQALLSNSKRTHCHCKLTSLRTAKVVSSCIILLLTTLILGKIIRVDIVTLTVQVLYEFAVEGKGSGSDDSAFSKAFPWQNLECRTDVSIGDEAMNDVNLMLACTSIFYKRFGQTVIAFGTCVLLHIVLTGCWLFSRIFFLATWPILAFVKYGEMPTGGVTADMATIRNEASDPETATQLYATLNYLDTGVLLPPTTQTAGPQQQGGSVSWTASDPSVGTGMPNTAVPNEVGAQQLQSPSSSGFIGGGSATASVGVFPIAGSAPTTAFTNSGSGSVFVPINAVDAEAQRPAQSSIPGSRSLVVRGTRRAVTSARRIGFKH